VLFSEEKLEHVVDLQFMDSVLSLNLISKPHWVIVNDLSTDGGVRGRLAISVADFFQDREVRLVDDASLKEAELLFELCHEGQSVSHFSLPLVGAKLPLCSLEPDYVVLNENEQSVKVRLRNRVGFEPVRVETPATSKESSNCEFDAESREITLNIALTNKSPSVQVVPVTVEASDARSCNLNLVVVLN